MKIVILYENQDRAMKESLDRHLAQLLRNGTVNIWDTDMVKPGQIRDEVINNQLGIADLVLLLASPNFWASQDCYDQALKALELSAEQPAKKIVAVMLRPNLIEDTDFKEFEQLPAKSVCITQYADPEQGYWDTYQELIKIIQPGYQYKKRPKMAMLQAFILGLSMLLLCCVFVWFLPFLLPEPGLRVVSEPFWNKADSSLYYKVYKLDNAPQKDIVLAFSIALADTFRYGPIITTDSMMIKMDDDKWAISHVTYLSPDNYSIRQCIEVDFDANDEGEYRYNVLFGKPLFPADLSAFDRKLDHDGRLCGIPGSTAADIKYFLWRHYFYLPSVRRCIIPIAFILISLLAYCHLYRKKISAYV